MDPNRRGWELFSAPQRTDEQLREALALFEEALKLAPDDGVPLANLCEALVALGRADEAIARAEQESRSAHSMRAASALNWLGWFWMRKPDTNEQAIERLRKAIALRPWWALPHANLAQALEAKGLAEEAYLEHGRALRTNDRFDRAFSHERRAAFEARQGWLRNALKTFRAALQLERKNGGSRVKTYEDAIAWLLTALRAAGIEVLEEDDRRWQRACELELPPGWEMLNAWNEPLADESLEVERLVRAGRWDETVRQLEKLRANHYNHFFDAVGFAEKGATLAREAGEREVAKKLLELCLDAYRWYAAGATSGGEGMERMIDVNRLEDALKNA